MKRGDIQEENNFRWDLWKKINERLNNQERWEIIEWLLSEQFHDCPIKSFRFQWCVIFHTCLRHSIILDDNTNFFISLTNIQRILLNPQPWIISQQEPITESVRRGKLDIRDRFLKYT